MIGDDITEARAWVALTTPGEILTAFGVLMDFATAADAVGIEPETWRPAVMAAASGLEARARQVGDG